MSEQRGRESQPEDRRDGRPEGKPPATRQAGWRTLWLGALALLTALFFYPLGLVLGIATIVTGVRARREARRAEDAVPGIVPGIVLGSFGLLFSLLSVSLTMFLWSEMTGYQDCIRSSNTTIDEQTCRDEFYPKIEERLGLPKGSMDKYGDLL